MVRRTCTAIAVLAQAETQLSPIGVTWGSAALGPCSLRIGSQELTVRHGPIVPRCPGNGPETPSLIEAKRRNKTGGVRIEPGWSPPHGSFVRLLSHPKHKTHVRTHVDPGRAPRRHPHLRRDPLFAIQNVRTYKQDLRPAQQEEEAGLAQGKLRRQLRTGRALLALGLSGLRRQQSGTGYCEMLNDRLQFSWCSMCP